MSANTVKAALAATVLVAVCGAAWGGASSLIDSQFGSAIHRAKGTVQITVAAEKAATTLPAGYHEVPRIASDDDGGEGSSVDKVVRNASVWNTGVSRYVCGVSQSTMALRIADCAIQHSVKPSWDAGVSGAISWDGTVKGNSGEGSWTLVTVYKRGAANGTTCDSTCSEVWRDDRTGLVWSDHLGDANWCKAAGASNRAGSPYAEDDPSNYCDNATYQSQTAPVSLCYEDAAWLSTPTGYTDGSTFEFDNAKVGLRGASTPSVDWRLPTIEDWRLANINGVRHVLPNMSHWFWSASVFSGDRSCAWFFYGDEGYISYFGYRNGNDDDVSGVRCVGR